MLVAKRCVLDQTHGYWLLSNVFNSVFLLCIVIKVDVCKIEVMKWPFVQGDFTLEQ
jgi:hypothetical protein